LKPVHIVIGIGAVENGNIALPGKFSRQMMRALRIDDVPGLSKEGK